MATLKYKEISKMRKDEKEKKLKELKMELVRAKVNSSKSGKSNAKDIRKIIARILTNNTQENPKGGSEK